MNGGPDFIVIGAMKSATSTLHDQLAAQDGVFMSTPKEPNFFSDDEVWNRGWAWYEDLFRAAGEGELCGESSTHYTKLPTYPETVARIAAHLPEARFIYVMRDPVDRLVSHYIHEWTENTVEGGIDAAVVDCPRLTEYSCYAMQLRPYLDTFGAARVLPVFFESLNRHPDRELARIARFLDFNGEFRWVPDVGARNVSRERLRRSPWRDAMVDQPLLARLRRTLVPKSLRERVKGLWRMKERPSLSDGVRERVIRDLDRDLEELSTWLGLELRCENFKSIAATVSPEWTAATPRCGLR